MVVDTIVKHKCLADVLDSHILVQVIQPRTSQYNMLWVAACKNDLYVETRVSVMRTSNATDRTYCETLNWLWRNRSSPKVLDSFWRSRP